MADVSFAALQIELDRWQQRYGQLTEGKKYGNTYYKINPKGRREAIILFLTDMRELGYGKEFFTVHKFIEMLREACFGGAPAFTKETERARNQALESEFRKIMNTEGIFDGEAVELSQLRIAQSLWLIVDADSRRTSKLAR